MLAEVMLNASVYRIGIILTLHIDRACMFTISTARDAKRLAVSCLLKLEMIGVESTGFKHKQKK